jgi:hypothetical protein
VSEQTLYNPRIIGETLGHRKMTLRDRKVPFHNSYNMQCGSNSRTHNRPQ